MSYKECIDLGRRPDHCQMETCKTCPNGGECVDG